MELVRQLVNELGVTDKQAAAGAGALFEAAEKRLPPEEYRQISRLIPELDDLIKAGTQAGASKSRPSGVAGALLGILGMLGLLNKEKVGRLGQILALVAFFKKLGLKKEHVQKFLQVIGSYLKSKGGSELAGDILGKVLAGR
jgi:hypothetical protein